MRLPMISSARSVSSRIGRVSLWSATLTGGYALTEGVTVRLEYRHDDADEDVFTDGNNAEDTDDTLQAQLLWMPTI